MSDGELDRLYTQIGDIQKRLEDVAGKVTALVVTMDQYHRPCGALMRHLEEDDRRKDDSRRIRNTLISCAAVAVMGGVAAAIIYALKNGWTP